MVLTLVCCLRHCAGSSESPPTRPTLYSPAQRGVPHVDVFSTVVWGPLLGILSVALPAHASPAAPAVFAANVAALHTLMRRIVVVASDYPVLLRAATASSSSSGGSSSSTTEVRLVPGGAALLTSSASRGLAASLRPKLSIYAALRAGEATDRLERALAPAKSGSAQAVVTLSGGVPALPAAFGGGGATASAAAAAVTVLPPLRDMLLGVEAGVAAGSATMLTPHAALLAPQLLQPAHSPVRSSSAARKAPLPEMLLQPRPADDKYALRLPPSAALWSALWALWGGAAATSTWTGAPSAVPPSVAGALLASTATAIARYGSWSAAGAGALCARHGASGTALLAGADAAVASAAGVELPSAWSRAAHAAAAAAAAAPPSSSSAASAAESAAARSDGLPPAQVPRSLATSPGAASASAEDAAASDAAAWAGAGADATLAAAADAAALCALVALVLTPRAAAATSTPSDGADALAAAFAAAATPLAALAHLHMVSTRAVVSASIAHSVAAGIRAVPAAQRIGGGGAVTQQQQPQPQKARPSSYVTASVKSLRSFMTAAAAGGLLSLGGAVEGSVATASRCPLAPTMSSSLVLAVAGDVADAADSAIATVVSSLAAMESSLAWLRKAPALGPAGAAASTSQAAGVVVGSGSAPTESSAALRDGDRVCVQLLVDVRALEAALADAVLLAAAGEAATASVQSQSTATAATSTRAAVTALPGMERARARLAPWVHLAPAQ